MRVVRQNINRHSLIFCDRNSVICRESERCRGINNREVDNRDIGKVFVPDATHVVMFD